MFGTHCGKGCSQSTSLDDFKKFEGRITSFRKDKHSIMDERINFGLDQYNQTMSAGAVPFVREYLYYVRFFKCFASEIVSMTSDAISSSKVELQKLQAWNPVNHSGIYKEVSRRSGVKG